jgi:hypothetical protein
MAKKNFKEFVKDHKKEIIVGTIAALAGVGVGVLLNGRKLVIPKSVAKALADNPTKVLEPYKSHFGDCTDLWISGVTGNPMAIVRDISYQNFEEAGFEFIDYCLDNGITVNPEQPINVVMEIVNS